jgi:Domain of unknown function (DUF4381)
MQTPIPEPYDITEIPYIAWVPGTSAWLIAALAICGLALLVWRRNAPRKPRGDIKIIDTMLSELRQSVEPAGTVSVERASRIARRIVSYISGKNVAELTADELRAAAEEESSAPLRDIMRAVASFEEIGYSPPSTERDASARTVGTRLASLITDYRNGLRAP